MENRRRYATIYPFCFRFKSGIEFWFSASDLVCGETPHNLFPIFVSMQANIPFQITDWNEIPASEHKGETGTAWWKTLQFPGLRIRMVEYSSGYKADHWCEKGHIIYCIEGEMVTELSDGRVMNLSQGMTYQVSDELSSHRTSSAGGVKLFIVDGDFLKLKAS